jgi:hypothetical protein
MRRFVLAALLAAMPFGAAPILCGCERTIEEKKTVEQKSNGTTVTKDKKVTENSDGSVTKTETKDVQKP